MKVKHLSKAATAVYCELCGKTATSGYNKPHSLHRTKRTIKPNLQRKNGMLLCTRCIRTLRNKATSL